MAKNYYDILGVAKDASEADIKKAYKKAALKYHPDRQGGKTDAEKKEAEETFKDISHAYEVLSDPQKKQNYDTFGDENGGASGFGGGNPFEGFADFGNVFGGFGGFGGFDFGTGTRRPRNTVKPGEDIKRKIPVTIEDIFNGCKHTIKYKKKVRCPECHGAGGTGQKTCPKCHGAGRIINQQAFGQGRMTIIEQECPLCGGTGTYVEYKCNHCGGSGFDQKDAKVEFEVPTGAQHGEVIVVKGAGSESKNSTGPTGNFVGIIDYRIDTEKYVIDGLNVVEHIYVPYYKLLLGCTYTLNIPNGTTKNVKLQSCIKEGTMLRLKNEGLKRPTGQQGDYFVCVHYLIPDSLSDIEKEHLEAIDK